MTRAYAFLGVLLVACSSPSAIDSQYTTTGAAARTTTTCQVHADCSGEYVCVPINLVPKPLQKAFGKKRYPWVLGTEGICIPPGNRHYDVSDVRFSFYGMESMPTNGVFTIYLNGEQVAQSKRALYDDLR